MLYSFGEFLTASMVSRGSGARIVIGRERAGRTIPTELAIIIDRARGDNNDQIVRTIAPGEKLRSPTRGKLTYVRKILCVAGFVATSTKKGATPEDHLTLLDETIDTFLCSADEAMRAHHGDIEIMGGGYPLPDGVTDEGIFAGYSEIGARYVLTFRIHRGVIDTPVQLGTVGSVVTLKHQPGAADETVIAS
jgi:hypothetical protein